MVALAPVIMAVAAAVAQMLARTRQGHWAEMVAKDARTAFLALPRSTAAAAEAIRMLGSTTATSDGGVELLLRAL